MKFIDDIFSLVWDISQWFYEAYLEVNGWIFPFANLSYALYYIHRAFWSLLAPISHFYDWAYDVNSKVVSTLSYANIYSYFLQWFHWAEWSWQWISDAWLIVTNWIDAWWSSASLTVRAWIDDAVYITLTQIDAVRITLTQFKTVWDSFWTLTWPELLSSVNSLRASWDSFMTTTFPTLVTAIDIDNLITTTLKRWFPFYDELVSLWGEIQEFFTDPEQYVYNKMDQFFERFW